MSGAGLVVAGATVRFGERTALADVDLVAAPGAVTAVVGGDGAGKTTLLRVVVGRVQLTSGAVTAPDLRAIGYLPASSGSWAGLTVQENVEFVGQAYGLRGAVLADRAGDLLESAGLSPFTDRPARQLSGGMRRKLGVVMALLHEPELLVLDEPSTGVDPVSRIDLWRLSARAAARGSAVVMSTTYLDEAERAAAVFVLDHGAVLVSGTPAQVLASMPGRLTRAAEPVRPEWAWRRGRTVHEVWIDRAPPAGSTQISPDLEDVVMVRSLVGAATRAAG